MSNGMEVYDMIPEDWHEPVIEEWKEKLAKLGFEDVEILFSGFGSQGDGASFTGSVNRNWWKELPKDLRKRWKQLRLAAMMACEDDDDWRDNEAPKWKPKDWSVCARIERHGHHYVHEHTVSVSIEPEWCTVPDFDSLNQFWNDQQESITEEVRDLSRQIYRELNDCYDAEYEYAEEQLEEERKKEVAAELAAA